MYTSLPLFCTATTWNFQKLTDYTFCVGNVVRVLVHFFLLPLSFTLVGATISYFPTAATKFSCCFSNKKMSPLFFISRWALLVCRLLSVVLCLSLLCFPNLWTWQSNLYTLDNTADTETISSLLTLVVSASQNAGGYAISAKRTSSCHTCVLIESLLHWYACGGDG